MPCLPTEEVITKQKQKLITSGELLIGEPCSPYVMNKVIIKEDLKVETKQVTISGRKIPLLELRHRLLKKHEQYMRVTHTTDMNKQQILDLLKKLHIN